MSPDRRRILIALAIAPLAAGHPSARAQQAQKVRAEVWKSPACGCCNDWIDHLRANGFEVVGNDVASTDPVRAKLGMPSRYGSCHTALVGGYVVEGHVPAREIRRLLQEKPAAVGIAVPEMPIGSPGMDGPEYKGRKDRYDVLLVQRDGRASVYQSY